MPIVWDTGHKCIMVSEYLGLTMISCEKDTGPEYNSYTPALCPFCQPEYAFSRDTADSYFPGYDRLVFPGIRQTRISRNTTDSYFPGYDRLVFPGIRQTRISRDTTDWYFRCRLSLCAPGKIISRRHLKYFHYCSQKTGFDIPYKLSPLFLFSPDNRT